MMVNEWAGPQQAMVISLGRVQLFILIRDVRMPWQFGIYNRRPFQSLLYSMDYYYREAERLYKEVKSQDTTDWTNLDQNLWMREKAASRASFLMGIASIEAFANNILLDFSIRKKEDLPNDILNKSQKERPIDRWRLADKVYFLPTLCNKELTPPENYFKKDSEPFTIFKELIGIRNGIMHGRPYPFRVLFELRSNKQHLVYDDFDDNFWPITHIPRDFTSFNFECAKIAYENAKWVIDSLRDFIEKLENVYFREENIKLISPIIQEDGLTKTELIRNYKKYISHL
ncbi:hypothetical protein TRIP_C21046 [Candidatus Zixiibacteriota bacterium]|nr:hypothetical protein TRIP_C21046 [candidate division Zixibacteria bacterium]